MTNQQRSVSLKPSDHSEGGGVPQGNLLITKSKAAMFDYGGRGPTITSMLWNLLNDEGEEFAQYYSIGDPSKWAVSPDGKILVPLTDSDKLPGGSNASLVLKELVNAGFPENKVTDDFSVFEKLYAFFEPIPQPKRQGLQGQQEGGRERMITVPKKIHNLPWDASKRPLDGQTGTVTTPQIATANVVSTAPSANNHWEKGLAIVNAALVIKNPCTRHDVSQRLFSTLSGDDDRDDIAFYVFGPKFAEELVQAGFKIDGENISK